LKELKGVEEVEKVDSPFEGAQGDVRRFNRVKNF
jgi:hypothetical protein